MTSEHSRNGNRAVHQHYVPEFYLKRFACDPKRLKVQALTHRHVFLFEEVRSIQNTCADALTYGEREAEVTLLEQVLQRSAAWNIDFVGAPSPLSRNDGKDIFRAVNHFSIRTPLTKGYLQSFADRGLDFSKLGATVSDAFENAATSYEGWDKMFHLTCVRILHSNVDLLTSAFPTSSFDAQMDVDGVSFPHHVTMALNKNVLAHIMVRGFKPGEEIQQKFWMGPAEDEIVYRHNSGQIGRFLTYEKVGFLIHSGAGTTPLLEQRIRQAGWVPDPLPGGRRRYKRAPVQPERQSSHSD